MTDVRVPIRLLSPDATPPGYAHPGDAGADLCAAEDVVLGPGERCLVATGIAIELPEGHVGLVNPRSGLANRHGLSIVNAPGTIDSGYRGEVKVNLINTDREQVVTLRKGDRIAQLVIVPVVRAAFHVADELSTTRRGESGHGSTGRHGPVGMHVPKEQ